MIKIKNLKKKYGELEVLKGISTEIKEGEVISIIGPSGSGKSTFLNALIGKDILKHGTQETTATITEIRNEKVENDRIVFDVVYNNGIIEENINIDKLKDYTTTFSSLYSVAENIAKVIVKTHFLDYEGELSLIDTPGLNGIADKHREKTEEQIKNSHACIYLMSVRGLGESDIRFLKYISEYQKNIIFVQNFIDELKELEKALDTFIFDLKDNIKTDDEQSQRIKDLRAEMARSLKEMKNIFVNDKTLEMVKQNLRDDVQRFLDQQKADNEQNNRIRHLEVQEFSQNIKDKNQSEAIDSNKKSINELRSEIAELKTKNLDFQHNLKNTKIVMWIGFILLIGAIALLHIL